MAIDTGAPTITQSDITGPGAWWCSGCGDFGVTAAFKTAMLTLVNDLEIPKERIFVVSGIGCSSKEPEMLRVNSYHGQHGRSIPVAMGLAMANPSLVVVDFGGDGDSYAIGMEHFVHACVRNVNMTLIVMNNQVYGLTKGQASPTAHVGLRTGSTPEGRKGRPVNPLRLAIAAGAAFVARGVSWNKKELTNLMNQAISTRGFSLLDVFSPCVTYHREPGFRGSGPIVDWYRQNYVLDIQEAWRDMRDQVLTDDERVHLPAEYDPTSPGAAMSGLRLIEEASRMGREVTGLLLLDESQPTLDETLGVSAERPPALADISLASNREEYQALLADLR
ncbi:MAG: thiamine pyrophosphate-dependent enzyme [Dehalococcoidia bacterium]